MATFTYTYSLSVDFGGNLATDQLRTEIEADGGIAPTCLAVVSNLTTPDDVDIIFDAALSGGEETTLDGIVAAHVVQPTSISTNSFTLVPTITKYRSTKYTRVYAIIYAGSNNVGTINRMFAVSHMDSALTNYSLKVFDTTNRNILAENTFTNTKEQIVELTPINNIPTDQALLELHVKLTGSGGKVYVNSALFEYL